MESPRLPSFHKPSKHHWKTDHTHQPYEGDEVLDWRLLCRLSSLVVWGTFTLLRFTSSRDCKLKNSGSIPPRPLVAFSSIDTAAYARKHSKPIEPGG
jgi:hypothetical protein